MTPETSWEPNLRDNLSVPLTDGFNPGGEIFSLLVASVKDYAIFMLDPHGRIMTWNEGAQRAKGYTAQEAIGKHFSIFYTKEAREADHPMKELELALQNGRYEEEGWRLRKDGSQFWANVVITAVKDRTGKLVGFAKVTRDLSERKQAELEKEEVARRLADSNEELQRLAYVVSHELQAPIATISRYCRLLAVRYKDRLGQDANDFMDSITDASDLIARIVDDLWTYARVNKPNTEFRQVNLSDLVRDTLQQLQDKLSDNEVSIENLPIVRGNKQQLSYLFKELILNAVKYCSDDPPRIEIEVRAEQKGWLFSVKDNGVGIEEALSTEVFKMFHRLSGRTISSATGMGLTICKKIVEVHKGHIWFESAGAGKGTTFFVWLPD